jgi:hypothetical protein
LGDFGAALRKKIIAQVSAAKQSVEKKEKKKPDQIHSKRLMHVSDLNHTYDQYLPFNNMHINSDYLLIKDTLTVDNRLKQQLAIEPIYCDTDKLRQGKPGKKLQYQVSRDNHPFSRQAGAIPETHQFIMYQEYKKRTRGYGQLGKGLCNMQFLSQDTLKMDGGVYDETQRTLINEKHLRGQLKMG